MILIAEDIPEIVALFSEVLSDAGYEVEAVTNGTDALVRLLDKRRSYDLVLMDLAMPGIGGLDVVRRAHAQGVMSPIIAISGAHYAPEEIAAAGFVATMEKPVLISEMLDLVAQHCPLGA